MEGFSYTDQEPIENINPSLEAGVSDITDGEQVSYAEFTEASSRIEKQRSGLIQRINNFLHKYRKVVYTAIAFEGLTALYLGGKVAYKDFEDSQHVDLPNIQYRAPGNTPSDEKKNLLNVITYESAIYPGWITERDSVASPEERREVAGLPADTKVEGFSELGMSDEQIRAIITETIPKGFLRNIRAITYVDKRVEMPAIYGAKLSKSSEQTGNASSSKKTIEIVKGAKKETKSWIAHNLIPHEIFHLQDPDSNSLLTVDERIDLYKKVMDRVKSPDRYKSGYVEAISNIDKRVQMERKVGEYFAEIGSVYLSPDYYLLPNADKELIRDLIAKIDPNFNRAKALKDRMTLIGEKVPDGTLPTFEEWDKKSGIEFIVPSIERRRAQVQMMFEKANHAATPEEIEKETQLWHADDLAFAEKNARNNYKLAMEVLKKAQKVYKEEK